MVDCAYLLRENQGDARGPYHVESTLRGMDPELTTELKSEEAVTDERAGVFTPDKNGYTADGAGCVPVD